MVPYSKYNKICARLSPEVYQEFITRLWIIYLNQSLLLFTYVRIGMRGKVESASILLAYGR